MPLAEGARFADFAVLRVLGSGGMGEVYLVRAPRLVRNEALKILPRGLSDDPDYRNRFDREADAAASLYHPNIVGVHDRGEQLWISMDYVEGADAGVVLRNTSPTGLPREQVLTIVAAVADALDYAHSRGLLHRDVKPAGRGQFSAAVDTPQHFEYSTTRGRSRRPWDTLMTRQGRRV